VRQADHSSRGVLPSVVRLTECDREASIMRRAWPSRAVAREKKEDSRSSCA
jgi:hypothetical protein